MVAAAAQVARCHVLHDGVIERIAARDAPVPGTGDVRLLADRARRVGRAPRGRERRPIPHWLNLFSGTRRAQTHSLVMMNIGRISKLW
jgi:hypothetical protein